LAADSLFFITIPGVLKFLPQSSDPFKSGILSEALVDPHVYPEQRGWAPESGTSEEGVNYLRRLKGEPAEAAPADAAAQHDARVAAAMAASGLEERRKSPRLRCSGSAEIRHGDGDVPMWGTLTDVSLHGCYVEMSNTLPVESRVALVLNSCGIRIHAPGRVRATYPALGMGICFVEIEPSQQLLLKQLLALLTGRGVASVSARAREDHVKDENFSKETLQSADPAAVFDEIVEFFQKNQLLSHTEFYEIAKRVRRP
jgi:hypothetical protein